MTIIKTFEPEDDKKRNFFLFQINNKFVILTVLGLLALTLIEIWVTNTSVAYGERFEKLTDAERNLNLENQILENQIAHHASLNNIASKSAQLGFSYNSNIQYIR